MTTEPWRLVLAASAERSLAQLPPRIAAAIVEFVLGPLTETPRRLGHPLGRELADLCSARRGAYRIVYELDDVDRAVNVVRTDHRSNVHRSR